MITYWAKIHSDVSDAMLLTDVTVRWDVVVVLLLLLLLLTDVTVRWEVGCRPLKKTIPLCIGPGATLCCTLSAAPISRPFPHLLPLFWEGEGGFFFLVSSLVSLSGFFLSFLAECLRRRSSSAVA